MKTGLQAQVKAPSKPSFTPVYASVEVSYLLQCGGVPGASVLTSNLEASLDTAFQRRLRFVVQFAFLDQTLHEAIRHSAFPFDPGSKPQRVGVEAARGIGKEMKI